MLTVKLKESCFKRCDDRQLEQRALSVLANVQIRIIHLETAPDDPATKVELTVLHWVEGMFEEYMPYNERVIEEIIEG
jgi:hypothetical protein